MSCIGGHVSVSGGLVNGIKKAREIGAQAIQIFGSSPRQWATRMPDPAAVNIYRTALKESDICAVFLHAPYLINLASTKDDLWSKSLNAMIAHLQIAELIGARGLIFHVGSISGTTKMEAIARSVEAIRHVLQQVSGKALLVMENLAGGDSRVGSSFDDLSVLKEQINSKRVKVCFDTAHAFEAGLIPEYTPKAIKRLFDEFDDKIGIENLAALHVNDSLSAFNSRHDRHANIGQGHIGMDGFRNLAREKRVRDLPWLLEVPGFDGLGPDQKNIELLKSCFARVPLRG